MAKYDSLKSGHAQSRVGAGSGTVDLGREALPNGVLVLQVWPVARSDLCLWTQTLTRALVIRV